MFNSNKVQYLLVQSSYLYPKPNYLAEFFLVKKNSVLTIQRRKVVIVLRLFYFNKLLLIIIIICFISSQLLQCSLIILIINILIIHMFYLLSEIKPDKVFLDHISYPVRPFVPKPIQFRHCWKFGHSSLVCRHDLEICGKKNPSIISNQ